MLCEQQGIIKHRIYQLKIPITTASVTSIKKFWTGDGKATKKDMIAEANKRLNISTINNDNEADALALLYFVKNQDYVTTF